MEEVFTSALGTNCVLTCYVQYVIVKAQLLGIYANKQTESESHIVDAFLNSFKGSEKLGVPDFFRKSKNIVTL